MTRDLVIVPVAESLTPQTARERYREMSDSVVQPDSANIIEVADRLNTDVGTGDDGFLAVAVEPDRRGAVVCVREPLLDEALLAVLEATMDRDLAVYDVVADRLYDPRGHRIVRVTAGDGTTLPYLTETLTRSLLAGDDDRGAYLIAQLPGRYLHAVRGARGGYDLEVRTEPVADESTEPVADDSTEPVADESAGADTRVASVGDVDAAGRAVWQWVADGDWLEAAHWEAVGASD